MFDSLRRHLRSLAAQPAFTLTAVVTLSLGIGATSAILMLAHAVLIEALPYREPASLMTLGGEMRREEISAAPISYLDVVAVADGQDVMSRVTPVTNPRSFNLAVGSEVEHINGEMVGAEYFAVLGTPMKRGRMFTADEARPPAAARVVVLSHDFWLRRFGGAPTVIGTSVQLNELPYTVIGIAAPGFRGLSDQAQVWLPIGLAYALYGPHYTEMRQFRWLFGVARLEPERDVPAAGAALQELSRRMQEQFPAENKGFSLTVTPATEAYLGGLRRPILSLLGGAAFLLLIACTNVANLMLARGIARRRELAIRLALGATSGRLVRQMLAESLLLVLLGAVIGLGLAWGTVRVLQGSGLVDLPSFVRPRLDPLVVVVTMGVAALAAVLFALVPALVAARTAPTRGLSDGGRGSTGSGRRGRHQRGLLVAEAALTLALLAGAGLMAKGYARFSGSDLGFRPDSVTSLRLDLTAERYKSNDASFALIRHVHQRAAAIPGVSEAAVEGPGYPGGGWYLITFVRDGSGGEEDRISARRHHVSSGYFRTLGIPLKAGRDFSDADVAAAPRVLVVSERYARTTWPARDAVGQRLRTEGATPTEYTVIGVVADVEHGGLQSDDTPRSDVYLSALQSPPRSPALLTVFLKTSRPTPEWLPTMTSAVHEVDPALPLYDVQTMRARLDSQTVTARLLIVLMIAFAALGLALTIVGVYGLISFGVAQRRKEIAVRMALGARPGSISRGIVAEGVRPVLVGVVLGLLLVAALTRFLSALLYGVDPLDPQTLGATAATLLVVSALAGWFPARRAARVQPVTALGTE